MSHFNPRSGQVSLLHSLNELDTVDEGRSSRSTRKRTSRRPIPTNSSNTITLDTQNGGSHSRRPRLTRTDDRSLIHSLEKNRKIVWADQKESSTMTNSVIQGESTMNEKNPSSWNSIWVSNSGSKSNGDSRGRGRHRGRRLFNSEVASTENSLFGRLGSLGIVNEEEEGEEEDVEEEEERGDRRWREERSLETVKEMSLNGLK
ncbi:hypothetical protein M231_04248 [Tremella mesenterica]|uniref:Uncharacterized protein n=1 Tax=Tremella mesenterica TaxID=5217 RepID=A0A4Q1BL34_TREME|nr:hypothetical protein M231_04248 [Tremella mesenterica]